MLTAMLVTQFKKPIAIIFLIGILLSVFPGILKQWDSLRSADHIVFTYLMQESKPGDLLLFTHLARTPFEYYYQQSEKGREIVSYPASKGDHPGHIEDSEFTNDIASLQNESLQDATRCKALISEGKSCAIIFYEGPLAINQILIHSFTSTLGTPTTTTRIPERQLFYPEVIYRWGK
jgi:hypothetical protein